MKEQQFDVHNDCLASLKGSRSDSFDSVSDHLTNGVAEIYHSYIINGDVSLEYIP